MPMTIAIAQIAPVVMDRAATIARVVSRVDEATAAGAAVVCFGEAIVPGYPYITLDFRHIVTNKII
jgi:nitrilase